MVKANKSKKPPSRRRYEEQHPTFSCRLDIENAKSLKEHLDSIGCSFADFVKDALGREESLVKKRVEILASKQTNPTIEDRVRCLENLVHEIFSLTVNHIEYPPDCPRCDNQELCRCEGRETESKLAHPWVVTWKCPKCGFFINTYKHIDPESIRWINPDSWNRIDKPKDSTGRWLKVQK